MLDVLLPLPFGWGMPVAVSDLADQVQRRLEGGLAFLPLGRAHLARVRGHVLGGLHLAHQFARVATDAVVVDLTGFDDSLGVDQEGSAQSDSLLLDHDAEVAGDGARGVADEGIVDL